MKLSSSKNIDHAQGSLNLYSRDSSVVLSLPTFLLTCSDNIYYTFISQNENWSDFRSKYHLPMTVWYHGLHHPLITALVYHYRSPTGSFNLLLNHTMES